MVMMKILYLFSSNLLNTWWVWKECATRDCHLLVLSKECALRDCHFLVLSKECALRDRHLLVLSKECAMRDRHLLVLSKECALRDRHLLVLWWGKGGGGGAVFWCMQNVLLRIICQRNLHKQTQTNIITTYNAEFIGDGCQKSWGLTFVPSTNNNGHVVLLLCLYVGLWFVSLCVHTNSHVQLLTSEGLMACSKYIYYISVITYTNYSTNVVVVVQYLAK